MMKTCHQTTCQYAEFSINCVFTVKCESICSCPRDTIQMFCVQFVEVFNNHSLGKRRIILTLGNKKLPLNVP